MHDLRLRRTRRRPRHRRRGARRTTARARRTRTRTTIAHAHADADAHGHVHGDGTRHSHATRAPRAGRSAPCTRRARRAARIVADRAGHPREERRARRGEPAAASPTRGIFALNLVSSPGSGKTTLLVRTIEALAGRIAGRGDRGRPADLARRRPHPRDRRAGGAGQHRQGLPPRRAHGRRTRSTQLDPPTAACC